MHLKLSNGIWFWLDSFVILSFSFFGLFLFYLSIAQMKNKINRMFSVSLNYIFDTTVIILSAFGIYLGRFLRFNSWEIISNPLEITTTIWHLIRYPNEHHFTWFFTLVLSLFLLVGNWVFNQSYSKPSTKSCK